MKAKKFQQLNPYQKIATMISLSVLSVVWNKVFRIEFCSSLVAMGPVISVEIN